MSTLRNQHKVFVDEYLIDFNASRAYKVALKEAGFAESKLEYEGRFIRAVVGEFESNITADIAMKKLDDNNISVHTLMSQS